MREHSLLALIAVLVIVAGFAIRDFHRVCKRLEQRQRNWGRR